MDAPVDLEQRRHRPSGRTATVLADTGRVCWMKWDHIGDNNLSAYFTEWTGEVYGDDAWEPV